MLHAENGIPFFELIRVHMCALTISAIAIPNFIAMTNRAKEGGTKSNMHTFQLSAEDYGIQNDGIYSSDASLIAPLLPGAGLNFRNTFSQATGSGGSWEDRASASAAPNPVSGIVSYADSSSCLTYNVKCWGKIGRTLFRARV